MDESNKKQKHEFANDLKFLEHKQFLVGYRRCRLCKKVVKYGDENDVYCDR